MRRMAILAGLLVIVALASSMGATVSARAATMCTTSCPGGSTLSCTPTDSCTSVPGTSITCDGQEVSCGDADSWCGCRNSCYHNYENCLASCQTTLGCNACATARQYCLQEICGPQPSGAQLSC